VNRGVSHVNDNRPAVQRFAEWGVDVPIAISLATGTDFPFVAIYAFKRTQANTQTTAESIRIVGRRSTTFFPRFLTPEKDHLGTSFTFLLPTPLTVKVCSYRLRCSLTSNVLPPSVRRL
jgi:hypothetical protein